MIAGFFESGRPRVKASVFGPPLTRPIDVDFIIDPGCRASVLTAETLPNLDPVFFAPDDIEIATDLFGSLAGRRIRVMLTFRHDDGRLHVEQVEALVVPGPPDESRLGMDVLARWTVVLDGPADTVVIEPG